jgi:hypothetical protein
MSLERNFQPKLIDELEYMFPGIIILKNDPNYIQGFPDLLLLYNDKWAALETKRQPDAHRQPNQPYYIKVLNKMSYASFVNPENKEEVLRELQRTFKASR